MQRNDAGFYAEAEEQQQECGCAQGRRELCAAAMQGLELHAAGGRGQQQEADVQQARAAARHEDVEHSPLARLQRFMIGDNKKVRSGDTSSQAIRKKTIFEAVNTSVNDSR